MLLVLCAVMLFSSGCVGVDVALLATTATAGAQAGVEANRAGKLNLAIMDSSEDVHQAALEAMDDLSLEVFEDRDKGDGDWTIRFRDENESYRMSIDRRTDSLTYVRVNVGWFGPTSIGRLVLKRLTANLAYDTDAGDVHTPHM